MNMNEWLSMRRHLHVHAEGRLQGPSSLLLRVREAWRQVVSRMRFDGVEEDSKHGNSTTGPWGSALLPDTVLVLSAGTLLTTTPASCRR